MAGSQANSGQRASALDSSKHSKRPDSRCQARSFKPWLRSNKGADMRLWILLFTSFSVIFFAAVLVWWRLAVAYRQQKVASSILAGVDPAKVAVQSRVLIEAPKTPRGLARFFKSGAT